MFHLQNSKVSLLLVCLLSLVKYWLNLLSIYIYNVVLILFPDLLDQSIAAFVIAVLHDLTITVDGWLVSFEIFHLY
jgi:hypothetical protein